MTDRIELTLLNQPPEVARAQDELERFGARHRFPQRKLRDLQLALEEHLTNILRYAFPDAAEHRIGVRFEFAPPELRIEVMDDGHPFDPLGHPVPDLTLPIEQRPVGGLGIHMIRQSLDQVEYRRAPGRNVLVMVKRA